MAAGPGGDAVVVRTAEALRGRLQIIVPVLAVAALLAVVVVDRLERYHGNATGFVIFGRHYARYTHPPAHAVIESRFGYDGQYFYLFAADPLLLDDRTPHAFGRMGQAFRLQRVAYPALVDLLAAGRRAARPWAMLALNVMLVLALTLAFACYCRARGRPGWWALAMGLSAGLLAAALRDLSDPLAVAMLLGGLIALDRGRRGWAAALLSVAVLAREPMALGVVAVLIDGAARWGGAGDRASRRAVLSRTWPAVAVPGLVFIGWQLYIGARYGGLAASSGQAYLPPLVGVVDEFRRALHGTRRDLLWDWAYLTLMLLGLAASVEVLRRRMTAAGVAALLFGLSLLVVRFGDAWSYTRLSAPMFATLLLAGIQTRSRFALSVCVAAAALTPLVPLTRWYTGI